MSLYDKIGAALIEQAIGMFYRRAFTDPIISHFFVNSDINHLIATQTTFAKAMLGGPKEYRGKPLATVHKVLPIRPPHFGRRQVLMAEVLDELGLDEDLKEAWLAMENNLKPLILSSQTTCLHHPH
jgi:hemoglobin